MNELTIILEQIKKKIELSDFERINLQNLLGKKVNADKYLKRIYENKGATLQDYSAKFHIPKEFAEAFDRNNNGKAVSIDTRSGIILNMILEPIKQHRSGYETNKMFKAEWERYITEDYIVLWINLISPKIVEDKREFWIIKPKN